MEKHFNVLMVVLAVAAALCLAGCKNAAEDSGSGESTPTPTGNYLTFKGDADFKLGINTNVGLSRKAWNGTVQYSTDKITWKKWKYPEVLPISAVKSGDSYYIYLRGKGNSHFGHDGGGTPVGTTLSLTGSATKVECTGNIMTLLDYDNLDDAEMDDFCFLRLFSGCTKLTKAPDLPERILTGGCCYGNMFDGCTNLTSAPALPATILSGSCYQMMFQNCTSLTAVGKIAGGNQVTTTSSCFYGMFNGCSSLKVVELASPDGTQFLYLDSNGATNSSNMFDNISGGTVTAKNNTAYKIKTN